MDIGQIVDQFSCDRHLGGLKYVTIIKKAGIYIRM